MEECMFIKADEIRQLLGISRSKAYQIIRELNAELKSQGYGFEWKSKSQLPYEEIHDTGKSVG